jgi:hypothetical protein
MMTNFPSTSASSTEPRGVSPGDLVFATVNNVRTEAVLVDRLEEAPRNVLAVPGYGEFEEGSCVESESKVKFTIMRCNRVRLYKARPASWGKDSVQSFSGAVPSHDVVLNQYRAMSDIGVTIHWCDDDDEEPSPEFESSHMALPMETSGNDGPSLSRRVVENTDFEKVVHMMGGLVTQVGTMASGMADMRQRMSEMESGRVYVEENVSSGLVESEQSMRRVQFLLQEEGGGVHLSDPSVRRGQMLEPGVGAASRVSGQFAREQQVPVQMQGRVSHAASLGSQSVPVTSPLSAPVFSSGLQSVPVMSSEGTRPMKTTNESTDTAELNRLLRGLMSCAKKGRSSGGYGSSDEEAEDDAAGGSKGPRGAREMQRILSRIEKDASRYVRETAKAAQVQLGVLEGQSWNMQEYGRRRVQFGNHRGLERMWMMMSRVHELLSLGKTDRAHAMVCQSLKCVEETVRSSGDWEMGWAWTGLPPPDGSLDRGLATPSEFSAGASYMKELASIQKSRDDRRKTRPEKDRLKKGAEDPTKGP